MSNIISIKDRPNLSAAIKRALNYKKKNLCISVVSPGPRETGPAWWDGGSRTSYHLMTDNGNVGPAPAINNPFAFDRKVGYPSVEITDQIAMVTTGTFQGKPSLCFVYATQAWLDNFDAPLDSA